MSWTKIDDEDTEASWDLSDGAYRLHHSGLVYCNHHLTDGHIPASRLAVLMPAYDPAFLAELLAAGKWGAATGGYQITGFLSDQPSKAKVMARRERDRADVAAWRLSNSKTVTKTVTEPLPPNNPLPRSPVPVPVPGVSRLHSRLQDEEKDSLPDQLNSERNDSFDGKDGQDRPAAAPTSGTKPPKPLNRPANYAELQEAFEAGLARDHARGAASLDLEDDEGFNRAFSKVAQP
jgi:hypothetical protein